MGSDVVVPLSCLGLCPMLDRFRLYIYKGTPKIIWLYTKKNIETKINKNKETNNQKNKNYFIANVL